MALRAMCKYSTLLTLNLGHCFIWVFHYLIHPGQQSIQDFFIVWSCCWTAMHWVWLHVIITFILSQEMRCSFSISRRVMTWSSLGSVVRHCFSFAFIRHYDVELSFDITCAGGLLCPSFWSTSCRWVCHDVMISNTTGSKLMNLWAHGCTCQVRSWLHFCVIVWQFRLHNLLLDHKDTITV